MTNAGGTGTMFVACLGSWRHAGSCREGCLQRIALSVEQMPSDSVLEHQMVIMEVRMDSAQQ